MSVLFRATHLPQKRTPVVYLAVSYTPSYLQVVHRPKQSDTGYSTAVNARINGNCPVGGRRMRNGKERTSEDEADPTSLHLF